MTTLTAELEADLEFVHVTTGGDARDCGRVVEATAHSSAGLELRQDLAHADHVFLLRHRHRPVACLWAREVRPSTDGLGAAGCVIDGFVATERTGAGCSFRLLLALWSAQWLRVHGTVHSLSAWCRTDALHRYRPLGFETVGNWFRGAGGDGCVHILGATDDILAAGRDLGLDAVLTSALTAAAGGAVVSDEREFAA
jgi:hypothetical protein